jgi:ABC-type polysaccharide/polyol phosphate export permease
LPIVSEVRNLWDRRRLIGLLVRRDLILRYKRSVLGAWWTLLNPLLEMSVLWLVFSHVFRFSSGTVPYVVYLLSGVLLLGLFRTTVLAVSSSLSSSARVVTRIRIPAEAFSTSAALATFLGFVISLVPLIGIMVAVGVSVPLTLPLAIIPTLLLLGFGVGIGMMMAPLALRFPDVLEFERVALTLVGYLAPVFYPISIIPKSDRVIEHLNPLYHYLNGFRGLLYEGSIGQWQTYAVMAGVATATLLLGMFVFSRMRSGTFALL